MFWAVQHRLKFMKTKKIDLDRRVTICGLLDKSKVMDSIFFSRFNIVELVNAKLF